MKHSTLEVRQQAVKAYLDCYEIDEICELYEVNRATVYRWVSRYKTGNTLQRKRTPGSGRPRKITEIEIRKITRLILKPASCYGYDTDFWTIKRILQVAKTHLRLTVSKTSMYELLYNEAYSYKKPEKRYYEADIEEQNKWLTEEVPKIKKHVKKHRGILYFEDESNIALNTVLGKTWGPIGEKTLHKTTGNRASISAISALSGQGNLIFTLHERKITSFEIIHFLDQMLKHHPRRHLIVVMDKAPSHRSRITRDYIASQHRLHVFYLPARSPEFNPAEKVWNHLKNEEMKSHLARNKGELKK